VECDCPLVEALGVTCITGNFLEERDVVRHDTDRLCRELLRLAELACRTPRTAHAGLR
jgi:hypothetical protein